MFCFATTHRSFKCHFGINERKEAMRKKGMCFLCTQNGHKASDCDSKRSCANCSGSHHVFICDIQHSKSAKKVGETTSAHSSKAAKDIFLKTITLALTGPKGSEKFRYLLDAGSHRLYILSKASTTLGLSKIDQKRLKIIISIPSPSFRMGPG
jgi:hypothetical protein